MLEVITLGLLYIVQQQTFAVLERFGKYLKITGPGIHLKIPFIDSISGRISVRVQELNVTVKTKTTDNVFVDLVIAVQFYVEKDNVWNAFYKLSQPRAQMESYVFDTVRAKVPHMKLDEVFEKKEDIALDVKEKLQDVMSEFGYTIYTALVNDIRPDAKVAEAMNEINAQQRYQVAAEHKGEAEKILIIKSAEADAESKRLSGEGIAQQRKAIVEGLKESIQDFKQSIEESTAREIMALVLMTQYYDMLMDVGRNSKNNTILIPHSPGAVEDVRSQVLESFLVADAAKGKAE